MVKRKNVKNDDITLWKPITQVVYNEEGSLLPRKGHVLEYKNPSVVYDPRLPSPR